LLQFLVLVLGGDIQFDSLGGHTAEMFRLLNNLDDDLQPTDFILCEDDQLAFRILNTRAKQSSKLIVLPRPRKVGQSYFTSIFTSLWTIVYCMCYLSSHQFDFVFIDDLAYYLVDL
jgi:beta-1,4-N-acetylglucosaminyltransferase